MPPCLQNALAPEIPNDIVETFTRTIILMMVEVKLKGISDRLLPEIRIRPPLVANKIPGGNACIAVGQKLKEEAVAIQPRED